MIFRLTGHFQDLGTMGASLLWRDSEGEGLVGTVIQFLRGVEGGDRSRKRGSFFVLRHHLQAIVAKAPTMIMMMMVDELIHVTVLIEGRLNQVSGLDRGNTSIGGSWLIGFQWGFLLVFSSVNQCRVGTPSLN